MDKVKRPLPWLIGLMAAGILSVGTAGYLVIAAKPSQIDLDKLTVPATSQNLAVRITANGTVVPIDAVNLSPKTAGLLVKLEVEQGDRVKQGQIVAIMEQTALKAQFLKAQADLAQAQARWQQAKAGPRQEEIAQAQARLAQAQARLQQVKTGPRREEIGQAQQRLEQAQASLNEARVGNPSEINQAMAQAATARSQLALAERRVERNRYLAQQGAISQDRFDEVVTEARNARAAVFEAEQRLEQLRNTKNETSPEIAQLQASVSEARIALQQKQNGSTPEEIAQQEALAVEAAIALRQLQNGSRPEEIAQLEAAVKAAQAQLLSVQVQLQDTLIRAPFDGIITQKYATAGAFVSPDLTASNTASATSTSIVAIARGLEVLAKVPEVDIGQIKTGQRVEIFSDAFPDQVFPGQVRLVAPEAVVEQNVTSFEVRVELAPSGTKELRSRMNVDLTFLGEPVSDALVVPTVAIVTENGKTGVMVPGLDNQPQFKPITIGSTIEDKTQIIRGLRQGERVFIDLPENFKKEKEEKKGES
ncbi:MAG TPA: efflux transporter periplasmic adaptor subunit [Cyanobacteria bacterium UBA8803]|nr:efflux transporter periplasmic adaptor subunit [Cyanobacteria bacterium UBA9273]HBL59015.1 efflux transporter periplasmic adaptor subunit [Cyanobacteria bacterium UBA8803]